MVALVITILIAVIITASLQGVSSSLGQTVSTQTAWVTLNPSASNCYSSSSATYATAQGAATAAVMVTNPANDIVGQKYASSTYSVNRTGIFFNFASYSGWNVTNCVNCTILAAKIQVYVSAVGAGWVGASDGIMLQGQLTSGAYGDHPHVTPQAGDYNKSNYDPTNLAENQTITTGTTGNIVSPLSTQGCNYIATILSNNAGGGSLGSVGFVLRSVKDQGATAPTGAEQLTLTEANAKLYLEISYPTISFNAQYYSAWGSIFANAWTGLTLASIGIIITAAVGILALVLSTLGRASGGSVA
jgi:hypothetical protein